jgi:acetyltransferase
MTMLLEPTAFATAARRPRDRQRPALPLGSVRIRPIRPSDAALLTTFYAGLSDESRRSRFFVSSAGITAAQAEDFAAADHRRRAGFVAVEAGTAGGPERIVGHVCVEPADEGAAEFAVAVADELQGRGIGHRLLDLAVAWARARGLRRLVAMMLPCNPAIHRLAASLGLPVHFRATTDGLTAADIDLDDVAPLIAA